MRCPSSCLAWVCLQKARALLRRIEGDDPELKVLKLKGVIDDDTEEALPPE